MCFGSSMPPPQKPAPPPPPEPTRVASEVESARPATTTPKRRGTRQLTVRRPTLGMGGQTGTGVQLSQ